MGKDYRKDGFGPHIDAAGHLRLRVEFGDPADEDWTGVNNTPAGVAAWLRELADEIEGTEPGSLAPLRTHAREFHPRLNADMRPLSALARAHGGEHHQYGSTTHHHGPNAGPHARPRGWRDGSGVVLIDRKSAMQRRPRPDSK
jgi:hypothetical protein